jgi:hypothetical protein
VLVTSFVYEIGLNSGMWCGRLLMNSVHIRGFHLGLLEIQAYLVIEEKVATYGTPKKSTHDKRQRLNLVGPACKKSNGLTLAVLGGCRM